MKKKTLGEQEESECEKKEKEHKVERESIHVRVRDI